MRYAVILGYLAIGFTALPFCGPSPQSTLPQQSVVTAPRTLPRPCRLSGNLASPACPAGNQQTREFLDWANRLWAQYCVVKLDDNGNCKHVYVHVCWPVTDSEMQVISDLEHVEALSLYGAQLTDDGLRHLAHMPNLKQLQLYGANNITEEAWDWLKQETPDLVLVPRSKAFVN